MAPMQAQGLLACSFLLLIPNPGMAQRESDPSQAAALGTLSLHLWGLRDANPSVRSDAAWMLGRMGALAAPAVGELTRALDDEDLDVRLYALDALGEIGPQASAAAFKVVLMLGAEDNASRERAAHALGLLGSTAKSAVPALLTALRDSNSDVRESAALSLGRIRFPSQAVLSELRGARTSTSSALGALNAKDSIAKLLPLFGCKDPRLHLHVCPILGKIGQRHEPAIPLLLDALGDKDAEVRLQIAWVLGKIGAQQESVLPALSGLLSDPSSDVRLTAVNALASLGPRAQAAVPALTLLLKDPAPAVAKSAARALQGFGAGSENGGGGLNPALKSADAHLLKTGGLYTRLRVLDALREAGPAAEKALPDILVLLEDPFPEARRKAVEVLGSLGKSASGAQLCLSALLKDSDAGVRSAAVDALSRSDSMGETSPLLSKALEDKSPEVRLAAARALKLLGPRAETAVPRLAQSLIDPDSAVRGAAAAALGSIGAWAAPAVPHLLASLRNPNPRVREEAADALGKVRSPEGDPIVLVVNGTPVLRSEVVARMLASRGDSAARELSDLILLRQRAEALGIRQEDDQDMAAALLEREKEIDVSDSEVKKALEKGENGLQEVLLKKIVLAREEDARRLAWAIENGGDFSALARQNSLDLSTRLQGGMMGWFYREEIRPALGTVLFMLEPGQITIVRSPLGFELLQVSQRREVSGPDRWALMRAHLLRAKARDALPGYLVNLRLKAQIVTHRRFSPGP